MNNYRACDFWTPYLCAWGLLVGWCRPPKSDFRKNHHKYGCRRYHDLVWWLWKVKKMNVSGAYLFKKSKIIAIESLEIFLEQFQNCKKYEIIIEIQGFDHFWCVTTVFSFRQQKKLVFPYIVVYFFYHAKNQYLTKPFDS